MMDDSPATAYFEKGWCAFPVDLKLLQWVEATLPAARAAVLAPENEHWFRHQRTWFVGVDGLPNASDGSVPGGLPLAGIAADFVKLHHGFAGGWHRAQVSVCYAGYPQPDPDETEAQARYRRERDAAHVDGLHGEGPARRRHLRELHQFILGIPFSEAERGASPLVLWERSHHIMRETFEAAYAGVPPEHWGDIDVTEPYQAARRQAFASCRRIEVVVPPGASYLVHRHALHGVAPWAENTKGGPDGRMIVYFRPNFESPANWLQQA
jgi:hypothetical protein